VTFASEKEEKETGRTEAFSDGVFAIAITLLVLEIKVPHLPDGGTVSSLARALADQWPSYTSFVISFFTILIMWANHHAMFNMVRRIDVPFLYANGFLLLLVTFVPYPTSVLASYLETSAAPVAGAFYAGTYVLLGVAFNVLWATARGRHLLHSRVSEEAVRARNRRYRLGPPLYLVATAASFVHVFLAVGICAALAIFWLVSARLD
jgi:TMEM175 potassium channel family protein